MLQNLPNLHKILCQNLKEEHLQELQKNLKKKSKHLQVNDLKGLIFDEKVNKLIDSFGASNVLDLASPGMIPQRFEKETQKLIKRFNIPLILTANEEERRFFLNLSKSKALYDIESLIKSIPLVPISDTFTYLSVALTKLIVLWRSEKLLNYDHKETWYQTNVYGDLFDSIFLFDKSYDIKRSECHASTIKYLKKIKKIEDTEKDVKVDLIIFNRGYGDMFTCEDKAESVPAGVVQDDILKGNKLRERRLLYLESIIPYQSNIKHIEVLSAQFHGLILTIYGSKMTELGGILHYQKAKAIIPNSFGKLPQAAHFLLTTLSLQRNIAMNLKKLEIIFDACLKDSLEYLATPIGPNNNNLFFREDSPNSVSTNDESDSSQEWEMLEQERRIIKFIDEEISNLSYGDNILTSNDWEDLLTL